MFSNLLDRVGDYNPQLLREIKGKMTSGKVISITLFSFVAQFTLFLRFLSKLPQNIDFSDTIENRYCTGNYEQYQGSECIKNLLGQWEIRWELWWSDIFFALSSIGVFILLVMGTYLLVVDLIQEDKKGTLNFIRLSPIKAKDFFIGKMIGVPSLLLLFLGLVVPLHFWAGLHSNIDAELILAFYILVGLSCTFFYSLALLFASVTRNYHIVSALVTTLIVLTILTITTPYIMGQIYYDMNLQVLAAFNPLVLFDYLMDATLIPVEVSGYSVSHINSLLWYGQTIWSDAWGMLFTLSVNYIWWTYILQKGIQRIYNTPESTLFTKIDSYIITSSFVLIWFGFVFQNTTNTLSNRDGLFFFQFSLTALFFLLIAAISPERQTLLDWSRYHHYNNKSLLKDLIVGEKSPSIVAMMVNSLLAFCYLVIPLIVFLPKEFRVVGIVHSIVQITTICIFALIVQLMLMLRLKRKGLVIGFTLCALTFFSILTIGFIYSKTGFMFYFSPIALPAFDPINWLGLGLTIFLETSVFIGFALAMKRKLHKFGQSETKALLG